MCLQNTDSNVLSCDVEAVQDISEVLGGVVGGFEGIRDIFGSLDGVQGSAS